MSLWPVHTAVHDLACYKVRQRNSLGWGCLECLDFFFYISTCILYDTVVNTLRAFRNSHFGWWDKYIPWPPQPWSDLLGISQNLWPPGCYHPLAAWAWLAGMWSRTREKLAWVHGLGCKLVIIMIIFLSTWCWDACLWCGSENDVYHTHFFRWVHLPDIVSEYMTTVSLIDTVVIACGYNPTLAIGTVPCQLSTVKSKIQINTVYTSTRLPPKQTIHPSIHMLKIQWAFHPDSPKNHLATDTWKMTFHSLPRFHSRLHVTSHWRQQNMIQNFHTSHHRHHHVLQPEGTDNQWCTSWWRASPLALPSWAASFRIRHKGYGYGALTKKSTVGYHVPYNLKHQKRNVLSKWPSEIWNFQSSCHPKR